MFDENKMYKISLKKLKIFKMKALYERLFLNLIQTLSYLYSYLSLIYFNMIYLIVTLAVIFILFNIILFIQLRKLFLATSELNFGVDISIIIAAKNEEKNIPLLIDSLSSQNYPSDKFEVIIVDDNSSDNTFAITEKCIEEKNNFRLIKSSEKKIPGKKGALALGITKAKNRNILITDADCQPSKEWIASFADKFSKRCELIFGIAPYNQEKSFVNFLTCFENLRNSILTFSLAKLGIPYSTAARSFGFTKSLYNNISGYKNTLETLSGDDDLFIREVVKFNKKTKIGFVVNPKSAVLTSTENSFKKYLDQKARHTTTSFHYLLQQKVILAVWHLLNLLLLISPVLVFIYQQIIFLIVIKLLFDFTIVLFFQKKFGYKFSFYNIFFLQVVYEFMLVIHFLNALFKDVKWK